MVIRTSNSSSTSTDTGRPNPTGREEGERGEGGRREGRRHRSRRRLLVEDDDDQDRSAWHHAQGYLPQTQLLKRLQAKSSQATKDNHGGKSPNTSIFPLRPPPNFFVATSFPRQ
ncbi:hypothetical protein CONLIGDRAFT_295546 [Coniochaeta ligniaria NRRL 30616]|uniref:Uncharacterized protein n=1 Tax=Coniochaeta ligniaria NRRL 30616 TaxID=1408157 RepID=A0A1J7JCC0_9PEZI|nr:hypothetical protein CONLIGDRAFT_295546 [Coniochaeta ligniaria NRRL 30616]